MGTWVETIPHRRLPVALAAIIGLLLALAFTGTARAGAECEITIEPSTIEAGGSFVVSGNFGANAEVHLVAGEDTAPPEDSEPVYTVPANRSSFSATITMAADTEGTWTVWGFIPATECGDSAILTVTGAVPDTAMATDGRAPWSVLGLLLLATALTGLAYRSSIRPRG
jgi:hypothetical protein